jgi:hypothetical protein
MCLGTGSVALTTCFLDLAHAEDGDAGMVLACAGLCCWRPGTLFLPPGLLCVAQVSGEAVDAWAWAAVVFGGFGKHWNRSYRQLVSTAILSRRASFPVWFLNTLRHTGGVRVKYSSWPKVWHRDQARCNL